MDFTLTCASPVEGEVSAFERCDINNLDEL